MAYVSMPNGFLRGLRAGVSGNQRSGGGGSLSVSAVLLAFVLIASACGGGSDKADVSDDAEPTPGGVLRFGLDAEVDGLNPTGSALAPAGLFMANAVFDSLVAVDADNNWVPKLAKSLEPNEDFSAWTMTLREGVTFHDGTVLDAEAVAYNFNAQREDQLVGNAVLPYYEDAEPITIVDDLTVTYNLKGQSTSWPFALASQLGYMASPTWLKAADADPSLNQEPVGAGPFKFESRSQDSETRVVRYDDYFAGPAWLDAIEFYPVTDEAQRVDQLLGGAIDEVMTSDAVQSKVIEDESGDDGDFWSRIDDSGDESFIMMNTTTAPFDDIRAREALTLTTPVEVYNERIAEGIPRPANQMFTPDSPYFNADIRQITDDPAAAKPLIADYCSDKPDDCTDGKIDFEYQYPGPSPQQNRVTDLLTEGWGENFNVTASQKPQDDLVTNAALGNYEATIWRQFGAVDPYTDRVWLSCETISGISINWPRFCDEERTELFNEGQASSDLDVRVEKMQQISQTINDAFTYIFVNHQRWTNGFANTVRGVCDNATVEGTPLRCTKDSRHYFEQIWMA